MAQVILSVFNNNLEVLSELKEGDKIYIDNSGSDLRIRIDEPFMFQGIWRYWHNVSRKDAIHIITKTLNDIEIYFNGLYLKNIDSRIGSARKFNSEDNNAILTVSTKLNTAISGITKLRETYKNDLETCNELDKIITKCGHLSQCIGNMANRD
jgi:hypothetical protein